MSGRAEIELRGLDVSGRHEFRLNEQKLVDGPALDCLLLDLDLALSAERGAAPEK
jgi:hypothetical protein